MGYRRSRSPRKSPRCSTSSTRGPLSSSTTRTPTVARYRRRTRARRLPHRRHLPWVCRPRGLGTGGGRCPEGTSSPTLRRAAGRSRRRQLRPAGAEGSAPERLRCARRQAPGQLANVNGLTAGRSAPRRGRQLLYFQDMSHCSRRRKTMVGRNILRHCVSRQLHKSLYTTYQTCLSTPILPSTVQLFGRSLSEIIVC